MRIGQYECIKIGKTRPNIYIYMLLLCIRPNNNKRTKGRLM